jgi:hypothetical protein
MLPSGCLAWDIPTRRIQVILMRTFKALMLPVLLIVSMIGVDNLQAEGDLTRRSQALPDLVMGSEESDYSMSQTEYQLETGKAYQLKIIASGQKEYAFQAPEFSTSIFIRKVEAGGVEIKLITLTELEFEDAGRANQTGQIPFLCQGPGKQRHAGPLRGQVSVSPKTFISAGDHRFYGGHQCCVGAAGTPGA